MHSFSDASAIVEQALGAWPDQRKAIYLPASALRRLARLQAQSEGWTAAAQLAARTAQDVQQAFQRALNDACEDAGMVLPQDSRAIDLDWDTGRVALRDG